MAHWQYLEEYWWLIDGPVAILGRVLVAEYLEEYWWLIDGPVVILGRVLVADRWPSGNTWKSTGG